MTIKIYPFVFKRGKKMKKKQNSQEKINHVDFIQYDFFNLIYQNISKLNYIKSYDY